MQDSDLVGPVGRAERQGDLAVPRVVLPRDRRHRLRQVLLPSLSTGMIGPQAGTGPSPTVSGVRVITWFGAGLPLA